MPRLRLTYIFRRNGPCHVRIPLIIYPFACSEYASTTLSKSSPLKILSCHDDLQDFTWPNYEIFCTALSPSLSRFLHKANTARVWRVLTFSSVSCGMCDPVFHRYADKSYSNCKHILSLLSPRIRHILWKPHTSLLCPVWGCNKRCRSVPSSVPWRCCGVVKCCCGIVPFLLKDKRDIGALVGVFWRDKFSWRAVPWVFIFFRFVFATL